MKLYKSDVFIIIHKIDLTATVRVGVYLRISINFISPVSLNRVLKQYAETGDMI